MGSLRTVNEYAMFVMVQHASVRNCLCAAASVLISRTEQNDVAVAAVTGHDAVP